MPKAVAMQFHKAANLLPFMLDDEFADLVEDIRLNGQREPIYTYKGKILDGRNRYRACEQLQIEPKFQEWQGKGSRVLFVLSMNVKRRHLKGEQLAAVVIDAVPLLEEEEAEALEASQRCGGLMTSEQASLLAQEEAAAAERRKEGQRQGGRTAGRGRPKSEPEPDSMSQKVDSCKPKRDHKKSNENKAAAKAAKVVGSNRTSVAAMKKLQKEDPEAYARVKAATTSVKKIRDEAKAKKKAAVVEQIKHEPQATPKGPFRIIVMDPPWKYGARAEDASHRARNPYPDMDLKEIQALPVAKLAGPDCVLWLWTTNAFLRQAFDLLDGWGFENRTVLTWVKNRMGTGDWLRGRTEHCLMAVRGKPVVTLTNQTTAIEAPLREHSRKPDQFYVLVESLCHGNKLEMFAREHRDGWQSWGAELDSAPEKVRVAQDPLAISGA